MLINFFQANYGVSLVSTDIRQRPGDTEKTVVVSLVMRRNGSILSSFYLVQTIAIAMMALVTFLFHVKNFRDRVVVNLVLIVILTQMESTANKVNFY